MSQQDEAEIASTLDSNKEQYPVQNRFFPRFLYRDDSIVDDLLSQLENNAIVPNNTLNKFVRLYGKLTEQKMVQQLVSLDQSVYNDIQPGQIIEIRGKARLSLWEERADTITAIAGFSDWWKSVTGRDPWNAPDARQAYQGMTSLAAKKTEDIIIIVTPFNSPRFQFVAKLDARQVKCQKEELKTEVTLLGMVQRRLAVGETIDVFRLIPEIGSLENLNRAQRRNVKKNSPTVSPVDEIIKYPAVNIYPFAIY